MHLSPVDILILVPLVPVLPLVVVWYLPWESWIWERLPKKMRLFVGPYLIYASFALWHFHLSWWAVLIGVAGGLGMSVWSLNQTSEGREPKPTPEEKL